MNVFYPEICLKSKLKYELKFNNKYFTKYNFCQIVYIVLYLRVQM